MTIYILFSIVILLYFVRMTVEIFVSTGGIELLAVQQQLDVAQKQHMELQDQYLEVGAYTTINRKARAQGFTIAKELVIK